MIGCNYKLVLLASTVLYSHPLLKDLYQYITPRYASQWKVIGTLLGIQSEELQTIEAGYPTNVQWCCNQMLQKWLSEDVSASWKDLFKVIESPAVFNKITGDYFTLYNDISISYAIM